MTPRMRSVILGFLAVGCPSVMLAASTAAAGATSDEDGLPSLAVTSLPAYGTSQNLSGSASNVDVSAYHVATLLFLEGAGWWEKPVDAAPCTPLNGNGSFTVDVTTGGCDAFATEYALYLLPIGQACPVVHGQPVPPAQLETDAVARLHIPRNPYLDTLLPFAGRGWVRRDSRCPAGPGSNYFSPSNAFVDGASHLHLALTPRAQGGWAGAEVWLPAPLGYGEYRIHTIGRVDLLDPQAVFGIFTWDRDAPPAFRELDIELSRWGNAGDPNNAQFVVQPVGGADNPHRFPIDLDDDDSALTHVIDWQPGTVTFAVYHGHHFGALPAAELIEEHTVSGASVPTAGAAAFRLNLWLANGQPPQSGLAQEVVVSYFAFELIFTDGFESGDRSAWSAAAPL